MEPEPFFQRDGEGLYVPSELTRGPWDGNAQHGGPPSALLAGVLESHAAEPGAAPRRVTRLALEFLRPVPLAPLGLAVETVRPGRRVELLEATLSAADKPVMVARAWRLAPVDLELPRSAPTTTAGPGLTLDERARVPAPPEQGESQAFFETGHEVGYDTSMEFEFIEGGFGEPGPARVWTRMPRQVLAEKPVSPLQRVMVAVDSGSGISAMLDWRRYLFINVDLTVHLVREPVGEWICLDSVTLAGDDGIGLTDTAILDEHGPIGRGSQSLLVGKRPSA